MIYYDLQHHGRRIDRLPLVPLFAHRQNYLRVSLDTPDPIGPGLLAWLEGLEFAHVRVDRSPTLSWAGASLMRQMLRAMQTAVEVPGWRYFANISGACLPLKSQEVIFERLRQARARDGWFGHCAAFRIHLPIDWVVEGADQPLDQEIVYNRVRLRTTAELAEQITRRARDPIRQARDRFAMAFTEIGKDVFEVRPLSAEQRDARQAFRDSRQLWVGRQWVLLDREVVEWLVAAPLVQDVQALCESCLFPDEMIFPISLFSPESRYAGKISSDSLRSRNAAPGTLTPDTLPDALASDALIGRKFNPARHEAVIAGLLASEHFRAAA